MSRFTLVAFGWELGSGQGHIQRLVALAQKLETYGYTAVFALKSYNLTRPRPRPRRPKYRPHDRHCWTIIDSNLLSFSVDADRNPTEIPIATMKQL